MRKNEKNSWRSAKKRLAEKELESNINRDLSLKEKTGKIQGLREQHESQLVEMAVIFAGTLAIFYAFLWMVYYIFMGIFGDVVRIIGFEMEWITTPVQLAVWGASIWSAYRRKSVLDDLVQLLY